MPWLSAGMAEKLQPDELVLFRWQPAHDFREECTVCQAYCHVKDARARSPADAAAEGTDILLRHCEELDLCAETL